MKDVVIAGAARTPVGDFGGQFKDIMAGELARVAVEEAVRRAGLEKEAVEEVILGNCMQRTDEINLARTVALKAGFPKETTGFTVQRQCSSGMQAMISAYHELLAGDVEMVVAGGAEAMSSIPYYLKTARFGQRLMHGEMTDALWEVLTDPVLKILMGETAERLAEKYDITRDEQDEMAYQSHQKACQAIASGRFAEEIVPVPVPDRKKKIIMVDTDEHPRSDITMESLARLRPAFRQEGGTVTAGNASGINDGAAAVVMTTREKAEELGLNPLGRIVSYAWAGVEPGLMGYGPVPATRKALQKAGLSLQDIELIEVNEAFAAQYLACEKLLGLNRKITNVNGSGVSLGHPVGATGCRMVVTLLFEMARRGLNRGLATLCIGGGMGMAMVLERD